MFGGQWKEKEKVPMLCGQWKEKEKEKEKLPRLGSQWKEKEKREKLIFTSFHFPPNKFYSILHFFL